MLPPLHLLQYGESDWCLVGVAISILLIVFVMPLNYSRAVWLPVVSRVYVTVNLWAGYKRRISFEGGDIIRQLS